MDNVLWNEFSANCTLCEYSFCKENGALLAFINVLTHLKKVHGINAQ